MRRAAFALAAAAAAVVPACGGDDPATTDAPGTTDDADAADDAPLPPTDPFAGVTPADVTLVDDGYQFVEGPQWRDRTGDLLFSDIPASTIYRWTPGGGAPVVFRAPSGNSNGLALDTEGQLIACEHGNRRVSRGDANPTAILERFEGLRLNSPNDAVMRDDGNLYFTDPPFGIQDNQRELPFMGVFRVSPAGAATAIRRGALSERPNGIALSPDGRILYAGDAALGLVRAYDLDATGAASNERMFVSTAGTPDGMAVDTAGNLLVATAAGVEAFAPDGTRWGALAVPQQPANVAFGGVDHRTLFITARTAVYLVTLPTPGLPLASR